MNKEIRKAISDEIFRRHGYRFMEAKIKPVHIANALMRTEHKCVGRMSVLKQLFQATLNQSAIEDRLAAAKGLVENHRERWGRLGEAEDLRSSALMNKVLPLIRTLLGADGAVFGVSPELSSFSSPTALTVTGDVSDDGAGAFVHRLWGGNSESDRLDILDLLNSLTAPDFDPLGAINTFLESNGNAPIEASHATIKRLAEIRADALPEEIEAESSDEIIRAIEGSSGRGLDGYLRLLGIRSGFLYPQQKNPKKRLVPTDRTLEVLVASVVDVSTSPIEYRDFLDLLRQRWGIVVGGRIDDSELLRDVGAHVPARELTENSERFLSRLESIGLARRLADSVAVVGLMEDSYE